MIDWEPEVPPREVVHQEDATEDDRYDNIFLSRGDITTLLMSNAAKAKQRERAKTKRIGFSSAEEA